MKTIAKFIIAATVGTAGLCAAGQEAPRTAYFLDGYSMRHELNPAFAGEHNYVSMPALGNVNIGAMSNVGVSTFLYKMGDGQLTTFMNSSVGADEFLSKIKNHNKINFNTDLTVLSAGFRAFKGYNTVSIGVHADAGITLPGDLFRFMKLGQTGADTRYSFGDLAAKGNAFAEIALGHSHKINDKLNVGAKFKFLLGVGNVNAKIDNLDLRMSDTQWSVSALGHADIAAGSGLRVPTKREAGKEFDKPSQATEIEWGDIKYDNFSIGGYGVGFDLGATYQLLPELQLSASLLDLGFISWSNNIHGATPGGQWTFDGFTDISLDSDQPDYEDNKIGQQFDDMWDDIQDMVNFHRDEATDSRTTALAATLHLGAEYTMPFYKGLTGGFLFTHRFNGPFSWTEGRFSANVKPAKFFDATLSYGASTYGSSLGWMINFHPRGFNFFLGTDHQFFKITPQFVPVGKASLTFNMGINFTFGS